MTLLDPPSDPAIEPRRGAHRIRLEDDQTWRRRFFGSPWLWPVIVVLVLGLVVATVLILRDGPDPGHTSTGAPIVPVVPASTPVSAPASVTADLPEGAFAGDGHYTVGVEIAAGKYVASGPATPGVPGTWARCRLSDPPCGTKSDVIDSGRSTGQPTVTLRAGQIFETRGFKEWRRV